MTQRGRYQRESVLQGIRWERWLYWVFRNSTINRARERVQGAELVEFVESAQKQSSGLLLDFVPDLLVWEAAQSMEYGPGSRLIAFASLRHAQLRHAPALGLCLRRLLQLCVLQFPQM